MTNKKQLPVKEGLWMNSPDGDKKPYLLGSKCDACGEIFFPKKSNAICVYCQSEKLTDCPLSTSGVVQANTTVMIRPPGDYYKGEVPYTIGVVELPEGVLIDTLFADSDVDRIRIGTPVELIIDKLHDSDGDEIITYKFKSVSSNGEN